MGTIIYYLFTQLGEGLTRLKSLGVAEIQKDKYNNNKIVATELWLTLFFKMEMLGSPAEANFICSKKVSKYEQHSHRLSLLFVTGFYLRD